MKIKVTKGHLTHTEKTHIKALFDAKLMEGKVNRKTYYLYKEDENFEVVIFENAKNDIGMGRIDKHTAKFELK